VKVNGQEVKYTYDGMTLRTTIDLGAVDCAQPTTVEITYPDERQCVADGELGQMRRVRQNVYQLKVRDAGIVLTDELANMESAGRTITYWPSKFGEVMSAFRAGHNNLPAILDKQQLSTEAKAAFLKATE
jgi:hypothetical protein